MSYLYSSNFARNKWSSFAINSTGLFNFFHDFFYKTAILFTLVILVSTIQVDAQSSYVYYLQSDGDFNTTADVLRRVKLDASGDEFVATNFANTPGTIAIDAANNLAYVADVRATTPKIYRINLTTKVASLFFTPSKYALAGIALDNTNGYLYYLLSDGGFSTTADELRRVKLDGSGDELVATNFVNSPGTIAIDVANNRAFVADVRANAPNIFSVNLATKVASLFFTPSRYTMGGIVLDNTNGYLYYLLSDGGFSTTADELRRVKVDGSGDELVATNFVNSPGTIAIDVANNRVFVADIRATAPKIYSVNLSTKGASLFFTPTSTNTLAGIAVFAAIPTVTSVNVPTNGTYKIGDNLNFTVNFSTAVTVNMTGGTPYLPITIGSSSKNASYISGSGTSALTFRYTVTSGDTDNDGISLASAITSNGGTIRDAASTNANLTLNSVASTTGVLVDGVAPAVSSINRLTPANTSTNATSLVYRVTFNQSVSNVDINDFALTVTGNAGGTIASVSASSGTTIDVTINSVGGNGTLRLDLKSSSTGITDAAGNAITGGYTSGQSYTINIFTWIGTTSNNWGTATNWDAGVVPSSTTNVVITVGPNMPVTVTGMQSVRNITIQASTSVTVTGTLNIAGTITNNGTFASSAGTIVLNGSTSQTIPASTFSSNLLQNLTVNNNAGASLSGALGITGVLSITTGTLTTNNNLVLKSTATGTASVAALGASASINGNVTLERYIPAGRRSYRHLSSGVFTTGSVRENWQENGVATNTNGNGVKYGTHITGAGGSTNGFDNTSTNSPSLFNVPYNVTGFSAVGNTNTQKLNPLAGYRLFVRGDREAELTVNNVSAQSAPRNIDINAPTILRATGSLVLGTVAYTSTGVTYNHTGSVPVDNTTKLSTLAGEYSFIANPYWAPVNLDAVTVNSDLLPTFYMWDPNLGNRGGYVNYTQNQSDKTFQFLPQGSAVFLKNTGNSGGADVAPAITFTEAAKGTGTAQLFRTAGTDASLHIQLYLTKYYGNGREQDNVYLDFNNKYSNAIGREDAPKFNNPDENMAAVNNATTLMREARQLPVSLDTIHLRVWQLSKPTSYTISLKGIHFEATEQAFLVDKYGKTSTPLNLAGQNAIEFSTSEDEGSTREDRFMIVVKAASVLPVQVVHFTATDKKQAGVEVSWKTAEEAGVKEYIVERSENGQQFKGIATVKAKAGRANEYSQMDKDAVDGKNYYRLKSIDADISARLSKVVMIDRNNTQANSWTIYPNPVVGKRVSIQLRNMPKNIYQAVITNAAGQQVTSKMIDHAGGSATITWQIENLAPGKYQLLLSGDNLGKTQNFIKQ